MPNMKKLLCCLFLLLASCGSSPEELFQTAELELLQTNYPHATQLYQEIIDKHPNSDFAATARIRLKEIKAKEENTASE